MKTAAPAAGTLAQERPLGLRRLAEQLLALALFVLLVPAFLLAALVIRIQLGRPLLFEQARAGLGGTPFTLQKLRTMSNARSPGGDLLPDDQRSTPVTRVIRRSRMDEVPQLLAVVKGDLAFIGPRPLLPETIHAMRDLGRLRCSVRPGVTGWAQVNGNTLLDNHQKLALDIWYVDHRSLRLDLAILWRTVTTVLLGERINAPALAEAERHLAARLAGAPDAIRAV